ncbi:hypothetical protein D917_03639 [Trichinella nativa]|uniref:Uncharacterized protein n=1 Tax=Trichinella nativa TaxID=6335 RepID=A0A1Y3EB46_9BILA|nr:hypothetical protein D917_03639 [Trichinella nativa]
MKLRYNYDGTCMEKGWIEEKKEMDGIPRKTWYIPHHAVYRDDETSTRCRLCLAPQLDITQPH